MAMCVQVPEQSSKMEPRNINIRNTGLYQTLELTGDLLHLPVSYTVTWRNLEADMPLPHWSVYTSWIPFY